jgi:hypothetical protein
VRRAANRYSPVAILQHLASIATRSEPSQSTLLLHFCRRGRSARAYLVPGRSSRTESGGGVDPGFSAADSRQRDLRSGSREALTQSEVALRNNKSHRYLLRTLVSCSACRQGSSARTTWDGHSYYVRRGHHEIVAEQRCRAPCAHRSARRVGLAGPVRGLDPPGAHQDRSAEGARGRVAARRAKGEARRRGEGHRTGRKTRQATFGRLPRRGSGARRVRA